MNSQMYIEPISMTTIDQIDFSKCIHVQWSEPGEMHEASFNEPRWDVDLTGTTYRGELVTFSDSDAERAEEYVHEHRLGRAPADHAATTSPMPYKPRKKTFRVQNLIKGITGLTCAGVVILILTHVEGI